MKLLTMAKQNIVVSLRLSLMDLFDARCMIVTEAALADVKTVAKSSLNHTVYRSLVGIASRKHAFIIGLAGFAMYACGC